MAQGKLGATDKNPYMVTQALKVNTQTDKLTLCLISGAASF